jgi:hypothetical protein
LRFAQLTFATSALRRTFPAISSDRKEEFRVVISGKVIFGCGARLLLQPPVEKMSGEGKEVNSAGFSIRIDMSREDEYGRNDSLR